MRLLSLSSPNFMPNFTLGALVVLATACSFLVPWEWFLRINPASTTIDTLQQNQAQLENELNERQKKLYEIEQEVLLADTKVKEYNNILVQLARRQSSVDDVRDPFDEGPSIPTIIDNIWQERRNAPASSDPVLVNEESAANNMIEQISEVRGHLADYANQQEDMADALEEYDDARYELIDRQFEFERLEIQIESIEEEVDTIIFRLHDITQQSTNQYLAMRAVALGALGAFAAALAVFLRTAAPGDTLPSGRTMLSMVFGGIVALVVFALFTTRELSVYVNDGATPDERPDYWRVVILCLIAGAFADRLFAAARERVEHVTRDQGKANDIPAPPAKP